MLKKIFCILACFALFNCAAYASEYYVDAANGNDSADGSKEAPFATVQKAADSVSAGDTVYVLPGIYYGPVNLTAKGTKNAPITFKAVSQNDGDTIITNANKAIREYDGDDLWTLYDEENNIWVTDYTVQKNAHIDKADPEWLFPSRLLIDNIDLTPYESLDYMKERIYLKQDSGYMPGYPQGYYYDHSAHKLYLRLRTDGKYGSSDPNDYTVKVAPSYYQYISVSGGWGGGGWCGNAMGRDSYNFCVGEYEGSLADVRTRAPSYYVTIDGFTFETPGFAGVFLRSSDVTVKNCFFRGCRTAVRGASRLRYSDLIYSDNILIENCDYMQYPTFDDAVDLVNEYVDKDKTLISKDYSTGDEESYDLMQYFWWQRKGISPSKKSDSDFQFNKQFNYEAGSFTNYMGTNWTIRYNYIHDCFDGFSCMSMLQYALGTGEEIGSQYIKIYGNTFERCLDNAIEFENHGKDVRFYENKLINNFVPISWQPLGGTPWPTNLRVYRNIIHNTRDFNEFWEFKAGYKPAIFKFGTPNELDDGVTAFVAEDEGFWIFNNTIVAPGARLFTNVSGSGRSGIPFDNFRFVNNAVVCDVFDKGNGIASLMYNYSSGIEFSNNFFALDNMKQYSYVGDTVTENGGAVLDSPESMGFQKITRLELNPVLKSDSPLIGAGIADRHEPDMSRDVGALRYGESD